MISRRSGKQPAFSAHPVERERFGNALRRNLRKTNAGREKRNERSMAFQE